jgi:hypothetical protein
MRPVAWSTLSTTYSESEPSIVTLSPTDTVFPEPGLADFVSEPTFTS